MDTKNLALPGQIDIKEYVDILLRRKKILIISFIIPVIIGVIFIFSGKKISYVSTASLEVNAGVKMPLEDKIYKDKGGSYSYTYTNKQIEIMAGKTLKERVINDLKTEFPDIPYMERDPSVKIAGSKGSIINIKVYSTNREYALAYANKLIEEFMKVKVEQKEKTSGFALSTLMGKADKLNEKIIVVQGEIQKFREENEDVLLEENTSFSTTYLTKLGNKVSELRTEEVLIERQIDALADSDDPSFWISIMENINQGVVTPAVTRETQTQEQKPDTSSSAYRDEDQQNTTNVVETLPFVFVLEKDQNKRWDTLKREYEDLQSEYSRVSNIYKPQHPKRVELEDQIAVISSRMEAEVRSLVSRLKSKLQSIQLEEKALNDEIASWQQSTLGSLSKVNKIKALKDEEKRLKKLYNILLQRIEEITVSSGFGLETVLIIEEPRVYPVPPKKTRGMALVVLFSLGLSCSIVFFLDYIDDSIKSTEDLQKQLGITALGVVHSVGWNQQDLVSHQLTSLHDDTTVEEYRSIRTNILLSRPGASLKSILMTSALPSEGKTTSSVNTSISLTQAGQKVLLIDGDLRRPTIHKMFNLKNEEGLSNYLLGEKSIEECIKPTEIEGLDLLSAGTIVPDPPKLLHLKKMEDLLTEMYKKYDKVIIDSAPILTVTDSVLLSDLVQGVIFVVQGAKTPKLVLAKAKEALLDNSTKLLGAIINNLPQNLAGHHYYYSYKYGQKERKVLIKKTNKNQENIKV